MGLKLTEETGELAEATLVEMGLLSKKLKEPIEGEVADVIQCAFSILVKLNPEKSDKEIIALLVEQLNKKTAKWENALDKNTKQPDLYSTRK
jgi:NTP pyrophosphatase (non-canonical NTP hydrolase)